MTHAEKIAQAKEKVVEAAEDQAAASDDEYVDACSLTDAAAFDLLTLESRVCKECGGSGFTPIRKYPAAECPACKGSGEGQG